MTISAPAPPRPEAERRFWLGALGLIGAILALIGFVVLRGSTVGIGVATTPASGATISGRTLIGLTFPTAMQPDSVVSHLTIDPPVAGNWSWEQNGTRSDRVVRYIPLVPLTPGVTYHATLRGGARATNGRAVLHDTVWSFTIRPPSLLFLRATPGGPPAIHNLWTANADGSGPRQITNEPTGVLEYTSSPDGARIAYTTPEQQRATAFWAINLDGTGRTRLSPVGDPSIYASPAWSPAGDVIVYSLRSVVPTGAGSTISSSGASQAVTIGASKIWAVAPDGRSLGRIYGSGDEVGFDPVWAPDGTRLAFRGQVSNNNASQMVLSDLSPNPATIAAGPGNRIVWSPDSTRAAFDESVPDASGNVTNRIRIASVNGGDEIFLGKEAGRESAPAWAPDSNRLAFLRQNSDSPATDLWVANLDGTGLTRLLGGDGLSSQMPVWSPDGATLAVSRANLSTGADAGIWVVGADGSGAHMVIPNGERATWIP